ncbi:phosphate signaling complex protein PhoU [Methylocaldum sp.]|uniref:phosphate signaling complex protein PhoU n=1 Tax=Methylocaldum sp. TaxID=1969727 RepID=UPI002D25760D|nr:phosphate signaling complex protein PhoU [Methylocaldum sp.]HYE34956.1 phosphate signaling complex protein PhoU [Methylocaldum sp.]
MTIQNEGHIVKRFDGELNQLHYRIVEMGGLALTQLKDALLAVKNKDLALARKISQRENELDHLEVETDADIVELIARRCPVGGDLRMVMAVSKGVTDLERIGDEAVKVANIALQIYGNDACDPNDHLLRDVHVMGQMASSALEKALEAFDRSNDEMARDIITHHHELEDEFEASLRRLITYIMEDSRNIGFAINMVLAIKALERIGAHAQNLAEYVIFQVKGKDVRHQNP